MEPRAALACFRMYISSARGQAVWLSSMSQSNCSAPISAWHKIVLAFSSDSPLRMCFCRRVWSVGMCLNMSGRLLWTFELLLPYKPRLLSQRAADVGCNCSRQSQSQIMDIHLNPGWTWYLYQFFLCETVHQGWWFIHSCRLRLSNSIWMSFYEKAHGQQAITIRQTRESAVT